MAEFLPLAEAIASHLADGDTVALEGFTHLIPFAAGHELIRQGKKDLSLVRMTPDIIYDQIIGMGLARKVIFSYAGNPGAGLLHRFGDAVENSWPRPIEIEEHTHAAIAQAYEAGAAGLPLAVMRAYIGNELKRVNPNVKTVVCPFSGEQLAAVPAINPDLAVIHAQRADKQGNVLLEGIIGIQKEAALAAKKVVVTVEEIVDELACHANACILPHWTITAIAKVPGGAHPSYTHGYYQRDNSSYLEWVQVSRERDSFQDWMEENVIASSPEIFAQRVKGLREE